MGITKLMKFITLKKNLPKYTLYLSMMILLTISINCKNNPQDISKESKEEALCKLESIHIPLGSSLPIMTYGAAAVGGKKKYRITVLEKDDVDEFNVDGNLFYTDKNSKESWYINETMNDSSFEKIKDSINMCKEMNKNKTNFVNKDKEFAGLRRSGLPSFMSRRIVPNRTTAENNHKEVKEELEENKHKSFLQ